MAVRMVKCPSCESPLKLSSGMGPGWKIQCPKCEFIFVVGRPETKDAHKHDVPTAASEVKHRFRDDYLTDDDEEEEKVDESAPAARMAPDQDLTGVGVNRKNLALLLAVGGGGLAIGAVIVYLVMLLNTPSKPSTPPKDSPVQTKDKS